MYIFYLSSTFLWPLFLSSLEDGNVASSASRLFVEIFPRDTSGASKHHSRSSENALFIFENIFVISLKRFPEAVGRCKTFPSAFLMSFFMSLCDNRTV